MLWWNPKTLHDNLRKSLSLFQGFFYVQVFLYPSQPYSLSYVSCSKNISRFSTGERLQMKKKSFCCLFVTDFRLKSVKGALLKLSKTLDLLEVIFYS